ncbi:MAG TPA: glutaredoxin family protein [Gaiellaceae bacterium]|nr:glutaredoxin family protein [Gaiellaceae bacterium]
MEGARAERRLDADGGVRARCAARGRGDDDAGPLPVAVRVTFFSAAGCHLCERAREVLEAVRARHDFDLDEIDISGDPELEARYREWLPVVEVDGERVFTYHVHPDALIRRLEAAQAQAESGSS